MSNLPMKNGLALVLWILLVWGVMLLSGCSDKAPDKPVVDKSQYQAPQSSFQKTPGNAPGAPPGPAPR